MKIVFLSNYFNHHQKPLSDALYRLCDEYHFIATGSMSEERKAFGYEQLTAPYVLDYSSMQSREKQGIEELIVRADAVIAGSCPESLLRKRKHAKKLIFRYSERPVKAREYLKFLPRLVKWNFRSPRRLPIFLLSASAYAPYEYSKFFLFKNRAFKWGYFTEIKRYSQGLFALQQTKACGSILWVARLIELKHPEFPIYAAEKLKREGYSFTLEIVGDGPLRDSLQTLIEEKNLQDCVFLRGAMKPASVREIMEQSRIFLFTSDKREGWGAVLNEAMNSGCAVIASHEIGAVPYLLCDGKNGLVYRDGDIGDMYQRLEMLLKDDEICRKLGENAYSTMVNEWSPELAASRLICVAQSLIDGKEPLDLYQSGPCSKAEIIKDDWIEC